MADILRAVTTLPSPPVLYDAKDQREMRRLLMESLGRPTQDTIPLLMRARVIATSATTVTVRVTVADPQPQGTNSVSIAHSYIISSGAGTVDQSSPQAVTPESTFTEAAGTYVDYVVTRPAIITGTGRITFTATAANRVAATDAVDVAATDVVYAECRVAVTAADATTITVTVTAIAASGTPTVHLVAITGSATLNSGAAVGATGQASGSVWVFNRGAALGGSGQVQFRATLSGTQTDDDFVEIPEVGQDTIYMVARARVTASTATTVTVRVAVADPYPQGSNSATISYSELGLGAATSPASGGTVTPASTITEGASTYIDYTVTRPTFANGTGRITFTASAANRVADSDSVDIPAVEQTSFGPTLSLKVTPDVDEYVVIVTYTGTMTYKIDGGTDNNGTGSPQTLTIARPAFGEEAVVYVFKAVKDSQEITESVSIPAELSSTAGSGILTSCDARNTLAPADGGGSFDIYFNAVGFPTGTTYNLAYKITVGHYGGGSDSGTATGITTGQTINHPLQGSPEGQLVVSAHLTGVQIGVVSSAGAFAF